MMSARKISPPREFKFLEDKSKISYINSLYRSEHYYLAAFK
jgi:hypothetical protein